ncbi:hypothetical protein GQ43DRAFT_11499 [Delitschia confertaspora ATCC 74209]|uniref:Uncharacterized protein n=1 Tax=Delitschia confertaspora ATCC 74209 TaxID=1513339 RepID=A0A9P4JT11_9PLEO|nr:hypothetical protein GQ43DRAFT_11499 [Delitschia confertaspora ATCC 74209]
MDASSTSLGAAFSLLSATPEQVHGIQRGIIVEAVSKHVQLKCSVTGRRSSCTPDPPFFVHRNLPRDVTHNPGISKQDRNGEPGINAISTAYIVLPPLRFLLRASSQCTLLCSNRIASRHTIQFGRYS